MKEGINSNLNSALQENFIDTHNYDVFLVKWKSKEELFKVGGGGVDSNLTEYFIVIYF